MNSIRFLFMDFGKNQLVAIMDLMSSNYVWLFFCEWKSNCVLELSGKWWRLRERSHEINLHICSIVAMRILFLEMLAIFDHFGGFWMTRHKNLRHIWSIFAPLEAIYLCGSFSPRFSAKKVKFFGVDSTYWLSSWSVSEKIKSHKIFLQNFLKKFILKNYQCCDLLNINSLSKIIFPIFFLFFCFFTKRFIFIKFAINTYKWF